MDANVDSNTYKFSCYSRGGTYEEHMTLLGSYLKTGVNVSPVVDDFSLEGLPILSSVTVRKTTESTDSVNGKTVKHGIHVNGYTVVLKVAESRFIGTASFHVESDLSLPELNRKYSRCQGDDVELDVLGIIGGESPSVQQGKFEGDLRVLDWEFWKHVTSKQGEDTLLEEETLPPSQKLEEDGEEIVRKFLHEVYPEILPARDSEVVYILGCTGSGKSVITNNQLDEKDKSERSANVSSQVGAKSYYPKVFSTSHGYTLCDSPGFGDSVDYLSKLSMNLTNQISKGIKAFILVVSIDDLESSRGSGFFNFIKKLAQLFTKTVPSENILFVVNISSNERCTRARVVYKLESQLEFLNREKDRFTTLSKPRVRKTVTTPSAEKEIDNLTGRLTSKRPDDLIPDLETLEKMISIVTLMKNEVLVISSLNDLELKETIEQKLAKTTSLKRDVIDFSVLPDKTDFLHRKSKVARKIVMNISRIFGEQLEFLNLKISQATKSLENLKNRKKTLKKEVEKLETDPSQTVERNKTFTIEPEIREQERWEYSYYLFPYRVIDKIPQEGTATVSFEETFDSPVASFLVNGVVRNDVVNGNTVKYSENYARGEGTAKTFCVYTYGRDKPEQKELIQKLNRQVNALKKEMKPIKEKLDVLKKEQYKKSADFEAFKERFKDVEGEADYYESLVAFQQRVQDEIRSRLVEADALVQPYSTDA